LNIFLVDDQFLLLSATISNYDSLMNFDNTDYASSLMIQTMNFRVKERTYVWEHDEKCCIM